MSNYTKDIKFKSKNKDLDELVEMIENSKDSKDLAHKILGKFVPRSVMVEEIERVNAKLEMMEGEA